MKSKTLIFIVVAIVICAAAVVLLLQEQDQAQDRQKLFADFATDTVNIVNQLNEVSLEQGGQTLRLQKSDEDIWQVVEKNYFPADVTMIRDLLRSLSEAEKIEEMSSRPQDFARLGIADSDAAEGAGISLQIATADNQWQLIVGNTAAHLNQGQYIRLPDENRSWLINRRLELDLAADEWLDKYIVHIPPENLHRIFIVRNDGESASTITIVRRSKGGDFELEDLPENRKMKSDYIIQQIAAAVDYLQFKEVFPKDDSFLLPDQHIDATFTTFDGLEFSMQSYQIDEESYATIAVGYNDEVASQYDTLLETKADIQTDNEYLSKLYANWYYKLLSPTYDSLDMELDDLTTEKKTSSE